jgi:hypothetical protein
LYTKATSCDLAPITQRANFCTLFNTAKKAGGARKAKVGQTLPTYYGEDSFREIDRGHDGETVVCASVAWFSSVLLDPVAPPPSLGGADAHAAALSGPQNLHLTHGGRSAADNHPPAAAFDTHKLQKRRTEPEARKIQRTRTRTRMSYLSGIADAATLDQSLGRIPKSLPYISSSAWTDAVRRAERRVPSIWAILRLDLLIASFVQI